MTRFARFSAVLLAIAATAFAVEPLPPGYKQFRWGMTKAQVRKLDPSAQDDQGDLKGAGKIGRYPVDVTYEFHKGGLSAVGLTLKLRETSKTPQQLYSELRDQLISKYGDPAKTSPLDTKAGAMTAWCHMRTTDGGDPSCDSSSDATAILLSWKKEASVDDDGDEDPAHVLVLYMSKAAFERAKEEKAADSRKLSDDL